MTTHLLYNARLTPDLLNSSSQDWDVTHESWNQLRESLLSHVAVCVTSLQNVKKGIAHNRRCTELMWQNQNPIRRWDTAEGEVLLGRYTHKQMMVALPVPTAPVRIWKLSYPDSALFLTGYDNAYPQDWLINANPSYRHGLQGISEITKELQNETDV